MTREEQPNSIVERLQRAIDDGDQEVIGLARELGRYGSIDDAPTGLVLRLDVVYQRLRQWDEETPLRRLEDAARQLLADPAARQGVPQRQGRQ